MARRGGSRPGRARPDAWFSRFGLEERWASGRRVLRGRLRRVRVSIPLVFQASVAAGGTWALIGQLDGRPAVFGPVVAVITAIIGQTQRVRRTLELIFGVVVGLIVGDSLIALTGTGSWQVSLVVALAMVTALMLGGGLTLLVQAAATAIIIAAVRPPKVDDLYYIRAVDAAIGGAFGFIVYVVVLPMNPLTIARRATSGVLDGMATVLADLAAALRGGYPVERWATTEDLISLEEPQRVFTQGIAIASEVARMAPLRWPSRPRIRPFTRLDERMDHLVGNLRVLARRSRALLVQGEPVPPGVPDALDCLARSARLLIEDLVHHRDPAATRAELLRAVRHTADVPAEVTISGQVLLGQVRSMAVDLLRACGLTHDDADAAVRQTIAESSPRSDQLGHTATLHETAGWSGATHGFTARKGTVGDPATRVHVRPRSQSPHRPRCRPT